MDHHAKSRIIYNVKLGIQYHQIESNHAGKFLSYGKCQQKAGRSAKDIVLYSKNILLETVAGSDPL